MRKDKIILLAFFLVGAATLVYEIVWSEILQLVIGNTVYAVSIVLTSIMLGLGIGSYVYSKFLNRFSKEYLFFPLFSFIIAIFGMGVMGISNSLPYFYFGVFHALSQNFSLLMLVELVVLLLVTLIPTSLIGAMFPMVSKMYAENKKVGETIGSIYSVNNIGAVTGSVMAGALLIPVLGWRSSLVVASLFAIISGLMVFSLKKSGWKIIYPLLIVSLVFLIFSPGIDTKIMNTALYQRALRYDDFSSLQDYVKSFNVIYTKESPYGLVNVIEREGKDGSNHISLHVQGKPDASTTRDDMMNQKMLGYLPLLLHSNPEDVLVIGLGSGVTLGTLKLFDEVENAYLVEINPAVIEAEIFFKDHNNDALNNEKLKIIVDDARSYLISTDKKFDVVTSGPSNPWVASTNSNLFTKEFFQIVKNKMKDSGIFVQWIPLYGMSPRDFRMMLKTFSEEFEYTTFWLGSVDRLDSLLVGSNKLITVDHKRFEKYFGRSEFREDAGSVGIGNPGQFLFFNFVMNTTSVKDFVRDVKEVNTDDKPILEFSSPIGITEHGNLNEVHSLLEKFTNQTEIPLKNSFSVEDGIVYFDPIGVYLPSFGSSQIDELKWFVKRIFTDVEILEEEGYVFAIGVDVNGKAKIMSGDLTVDVSSKFYDRELTENQIYSLLSKERGWEEIYLNGKRAYLSVFEERDNKVMDLIFFCDGVNILNLISLTSTPAKWRVEWGTVLLDNSGCMWGKG
ncbi:MAG: fused MFS/spermidine synthase [Candidatus Aenigmarchaeota archaeon]